MIYLLRWLIQVRFVSVYMVVRDRFHTSLVARDQNNVLAQVSLLGRLHHRNLVNLVGYCVDKGQYMLVYEYMSNGSLEKLLYTGEEDTLTWDERLQIALDISHGIEYLHEGAVPLVVHHDLKSANILLDHSMRAKVADFGLSKEEVFDGRKSSLKGAYGYMDPAYISSMLPLLFHAACHVAVALPCCLPCCRCSSMLPAMLPLLL